MVLGGIVPPLHIFKAQYDVVVNKKRTSRSGISSPGEFLVYSSDMTPLTRIKCNRNNKALTDGQTGQWRLRLPKNVKIEIGWTILSDNQSEYYSSCYLCNCSHAVRHRPVDIALTRPLLIIILIIIIIIIIIITVIFYLRE